MASLKHQAVSGVAWTTIQRFLTLSISFISNLVLARLLSPDDFGCVGLLAVFISISQTFIDSGFGSALIQKKEPTQEDYSTIFFWNLGVAIILYLVLFFSAPLIARFYKLDILSSILRVQGLILIINSLRIIQYNRLRKTLQFKKVSIIFISSDIVAVIVAIILAYKGYGVWCLVIQQLLLSALTTFIFWVTSRWKPSFVFDKNSFKELFSFGGYILLSNIFVTLFNDIQSLIMGKLYSIRNVGLYSQSRRLEGIPASTISSVISQVVFPIFSRFQNDIDKLKELLKKVTQVMAFCVFPLMIVSIIIAEPLIIILFSDKWIECVPFFKILCIGGIAESLCDINYNLVASLGKSKTLFKWTTIKSFVGLILICAGSFFGINGIIWAVTIRFYFIYIVNSSLSAYYLKMTIVEQYKDLFKIFVITSIAYILTLCTNQLFFIVVGNIYVIALIEVIIFCIMYFLLNLALNRKIMMEIKDIIRMILQKK